MWASRGDDPMFKRLVLTAACILGWCVTASAYEMTPILAKLSPAGTGASRTFTIRNPSARPVAIEIAVVSRRHDLDGTERRQPDEDNFIVTPPQLVVGAGQMQNIRVQYIGPSDVDHEAAYRLLANQLPIDFEDESASKVMVNYNYEIALYVTPQGALPEARLVSVEAVNDPQLGPVVAATVENVGNARAILGKPKLTLRQEGKVVALAEADLGDMPNAVILAGEKRRFLFKRPDSLGAGALSGEFSTDYVVIQ